MFDDATYDYYIYDWRVANNNVVSQTDTLMNGSTPQRLAILRRGALAFVANLSDAIMNGAGRFTTLKGFLPKLIKPIITAIKSLRPRINIH